MLQYLACCRAARRFRDYRPRDVGVAAIREWLEQFPEADRQALLRLLKRVVFVSEKQMKSALVHLNASLLERLHSAGVPPTHVVYVQHDDAGSSSPVMLNMLRDAAHLQQRGCQFLDSRDVLGLHDTTDSLGSGAIIYVDDFAGTGHQFEASCNFVRQFVVGTFSEFILSHTICEEAYGEFAKLGIEPYQELIHAKVDRPLHENSTYFDAATKLRLRELSDLIRPGYGLGYESLATMVVLYNNAPDTVPALLRGSPSQTPWKGIFPRVTDLAVT